MATAAGLLGTPFDFVASTGSVVLYTCPTGRKAAVTVSFVNNNATGNAKVRAGWATGAANLPTAAQWLLGGTPGKNVAAGETLQVTMMLGPGQKVSVGSDTLNVSASCYGVEEAL